MKGSPSKQAVANVAQNSVPTAAAPVAPAPTPSAATPTENRRNGKIIKTMTDENPYANPTQAPAARPQMKDDDPYNR